MIKYASDQIQIILGRGDVNITSWVPGDMITFNNQAPAPIGEPSPTPLEHPLQAQVIIHCGSLESTEALLRSVSRIVSHQSRPRWSEVPARFDRVSQDAHGNWYGHDGFYQELIKKGTIGIPTWEESECIRPKG